MLRSSRLVELASFALILLFVDFSIVVLLVLLNVVANILCGDFSGLCGAGLVVDPETKHCQAVCEGHLRARDGFVGHMLKNAIDHVQSVAIFINFYPPGEISR